MFKSLSEALNENSEALEFLNKMAKLHSPNGDIYDGGKSADEILSEIDSKRVYSSSGYNCPICLNKGGITRLNDESGQIEWHICRCLNEKQSLSNVNNSGLGELLNHRVKDFIVENEFQDIMKTTTVNYIRNAKDEWFLALGQPGCGKTMLCSAICNQRLKEGKSVKYLIWNEFTSKIKNMNFDSDRDDYYQYYMKSEVLYIDDLLKGNPTDYDLKLAFEIINYRYNNKLSTIISSELLIDDLRDLDEATASRIYQMSTSKYVIEVERDKNKNFRFRK